MKGLGVEVVELTDESFEELKKEITLNGTSIGKVPDSRIKYKLNYQFIKTDGITFTNHIQFAS